MKILSWNARGLGNPNAFRHLRLLVSQQSPHVLFLMETRLNNNSLSRFRQSLNFSHGLEVPRLGLSGGLMLLWKDDIDVKLNNIGSCFFDCYMTSNAGQQFHFSAFYGSPTVQNRSDSWTLLRRLADVAPLQPWLVIGDFNEILSNQNKSGGTLRSESQMNAFRSALDYCHLSDPPFQGDCYTWAKKRTAVNTLKERLDWCFVNDAWNLAFNQPKVTHLDYFNSDHRAISVVLSNASISHNHQRHSRFRFEKLWLSDPESKDIISNSWLNDQVTDPICGVLNNLESCARSLQSWHIKKYGRMKHNITAAQKRVDTLNNSPSRLTK
uniref:Endonuclease/exonuclease/phosphatase domain-containing protein n=1 Tax=Cannabis sativa TaxID=3483 RepID=A0A803PZC4_CANSA